MSALAILIAAASAYGATHCMAVAGLGGEPDYEQRFKAQVTELEKVAQCVSLSGAAATKAGIRAALEKAGRDAKAEDTFVLVMIGHGSFDGDEYKFNVPGPDLTAGELASALDRIPAQRQLLVNATSASGASMAALQKPTRVVVTATKSGTEKNAPVFARYWIEALRDAAADTDKNEVITAMEAFRFAEMKTKQFYEANKRLATEHPLIEGEAAQRFAVLRIGAIQAASNDPAKRALLTKREQLETQIDNLKLQKTAMPTEEYRKQLQALLLDLARTQAELDK